MKKSVIIGVTIVLLLVIILIVGYFMFFENKPAGSGGGRVLENPLKQIILNNTNSQGKIDNNKVIEEGIMNFNANYINYILLALGVGNLHKSYTGYGNPIVELVLDDETWSSEINSGSLITGKNARDDEDLHVIMSKEEAVRALMSLNIVQFMKNSVSNGNTKIEMVAGKIELGSKGYLTMYKELTGEEISAE